MSTISERLSIGKELRELKLGKSFRKSNTNGYEYDSNADEFHTIRYDFKPASVDPTKTASVEFAENNKATVTVPNVEGSGMPYTVFKGSRKPHQKECVLIIDNETGEITLERLTENIVVKKTRAEGTSKAQLLQRPLTPSMELNGKKTSPPLPGISQQQNHFVPQSTQKSNSPKRNDSSSYSKSRKSSPIASTLSTNQSRSSIPVGFIPPQQGVRPAIKDDEMIGVLSESSSDSSDNESVSGNSSDEEEPKPVIPNGNLNPPRAVNDGELIGNMSPSDDSSSDSDSESNSESSDDDNENVNRDKPAQTSVLPSMPNVVAVNSSLPNGPSLPSMPKFSQLSMGNYSYAPLTVVSSLTGQDLQLSESGSDSD